MLTLGIDIGKRELYVCLQESLEGNRRIVAQRGPISNNAAGLRKLTDWVGKFTGHQPVQVVMEATNVYWENAAWHFHQLNWSVSVVNPAQVKYFARSVLRRGKTDAMDAEIIASFGSVMALTLWRPPSETLAVLKQLTRERESVLRTWSQENNHLIALRDAHQVDAKVMTFAQERLALLERQVNDLEQAIKELVQQHTEVQQQLKLLRTIPGIALISAATILAETDGFARLQTGQEISAAAGIAPSPRQSGLRAGRSRISKTGNARLRRMAYLCALGASKSHSRLGSYYRQLITSGKPPKVALIAVGHKLLRIALAVVKSGEPYQDDFVSAHGGAGPTPLPEGQGT